jgi:hypothetical protein
MAADDLLRLAWAADRDGSRKRREALLTLAVVESSPQDDWAEKVRQHLLADRPDHFLRVFPTVEAARTDPRALEMANRLRVKYPPVRVRSLLLRSQVVRGTYTGRAESIDAFVEDLVGTSQVDQVSSAPLETENLRKHVGQKTRGPLARARSGRILAFQLAYPHLTAWEDPAAQPPALHVDRHEEREAVARETYHYYLSVLFAIAMLLASVQPEADRTRASA